MTIESRAAFGIAKSTALCEHVKSLAPVTVAVMLVFQTLTPLACRADSVFTINIAARDPATDTHTYITPQDKVTIQFSGVWDVWGTNFRRTSGAAGQGVRANNRRCDGEGGWICNNMSWGSTSKKYPLPGANEGAVVILLNGHPSKVVLESDRSSSKPNPSTKTYDYTVSFTGKSGNLGFAPNDDNVGDNQGSMRAVVTIVGPTGVASHTQPAKTVSCVAPPYNGGPCLTAGLRNPTDPGCRITCSNGAKPLCRQSACDAAGWYNSLCWCTPPGPPSISAAPR